MTDAEADNDNNATEYRHVPFRKVVTLKARYIEAAPLEPRRSVTTDPICANCGFPKSQHRLANASDGPHVSAHVLICVPGTFREASHEQQRHKPADHA